MLMQRIRTGLVMAVPALLLILFALSPRVVAPELLVVLGVAPGKLGDAHPTSLFTEKGKLEHPAG